MQLKKFVWQGERYTQEQITFWRKGREMASAGARNYAPTLVYTGADMLLNDRPFNLDVKDDLLVQIVSGYPSPTAMVSTETFTYEEITKTPISEITKTNQMYIRRKSHDGNHSPGEHDEVISST
jgi:hypothetical protein